MIGYVCIGTNDLDRAVAFYGDLLSILGAEVTYKGDRGVGWGTAPDKAMLSVVKPFDEKPATPDHVKALHAKCLALGGTCEGPPGDRGNNFYAAYFRDLDGNKLSAFCTT